MARELAATLGDAEYVVQADHVGETTFSVTVNGETRTIDAVRLRPGTWSLIVDGRSHLVELDERKSGLFVLVDGTATPIALEDAQRRRLADAVGVSAVEQGEIIIAPIAGRVVKLSVNVGDEVAAGDSAIVLEAMKMENDIKAERGGVVAKIHVQPGASVETGEKLLTLE